jgi:hypothetical protein
MCAPRRKLVIEVDGSQHLDQQEYDAERTAFLEVQGYTILRFWNGDVMNNIEGVLGVILEEISPAGMIPQGDDDGRGDKDCGRRVMKGQAPKQCGSASCLRVRWDGRSRATHYPADRVRFPFIITVGNTRKGDCYVT